MRFHNKKALHLRREQVGAQNRTRKDLHGVRQSLGGITRNQHGGPVGKEVELYGNQGGTQSGRQMQAR